MKIDQTKFSESLASLMEQKGITKYQLAKDLSFSQTSVANWLNKTSVPSRRSIEALARYFGVNNSALGVRSNLIVSQNDPWAPDDPDDDFPLDENGNPLKVKKPTALTEGELKQRAREEKLLEAFRQLPPEIQEVVLAQTRGVLQTRKDPDSL